MSKRMIIYWIIVVIFMRFCFSLNFFVIFSYDSK